MVRKYTIVAIGLAFVSLLNCGPEPMRDFGHSDIIGTYGYTSGTIRRVLTLRADGVFVQEESDAGVVRRNEGRWKLERNKRGESLLYFYNFNLDLATGSGGAGALVSVPMMQTMGGRLAMCLDEETEHCLFRELNKTAK